MSIAWWAALVGLVCAIGLIAAKLNVTYSLLAGAAIGALVGGANFTQTIDIMVSGIGGITGTLLRVLSAGVLAGVMMGTGAASRIARAIVGTLGERWIFVSLAVATMVICAAGVLLPVAVLIVAPIALEVGEHLGISKLTLLVTLSGGGKAGNIISLNPNALAAASEFNVPLGQVILGGLLPAVLGLVVTVVIAWGMHSRTRNSRLSSASTPHFPLATPPTSPSAAAPPRLWAALSAPVIILVVLLLSSVLAFPLDSFFVLPAAGLLGAVCMRRAGDRPRLIRLGLHQVSDIVLILIGAGAIGGLLENSDFPALLLSLMNGLGLPPLILAPFAGFVMAAASASTSTGVILAGSTFGEAILASGVSPLAAAVTVQTGAVVLNHLPHGNYYLISARAMGMSVGERFRAVGWESLIGLSMAIASVLLFTWR